MSFMKETITNVMEIWEQCERTPFICELKRGTLPMEKFRNYMIQDSIYLKNYARVCGKAIYHAVSLKEIQIYYSMLSFVNDTESAVRLHYLKLFGITDEEIAHMEALPENRNYIDFILEIAERGMVCEILMAVLPCMMSYSYIFRKIAAEPDTPDSLYWDFINDYADERYYKDCLLWSAFADSKCAGLPDGEKENLFRIFERASILELEFWEMAYRE